MVLQVERAPAQTAAADAEAESAQEHAAAESEHEHPQQQEQQLEMHTANDIDVEDIENGRVQVQDFTKREGFAATSVHKFDRRGKEIILCTHCRCLCCLGEAATCSIINTAGCVVFAAAIVILIIWLANPTHFGSGK